MANRSRNVLTRLALIIGLAAHVMAPAAFAAAPAGFDAGSLICAPSGKIAPEAEAAIAEMLRLAGEEPGDVETGAAKHCGACVAAGWCLPNGPALALAIAYADTHPPFLPRRGTVYLSVHGPPLGLRAPPSSLTAG